MTRAAVALMSLAALANGRIIFPDEYDAMLRASASSSPPGRYNESLYPKISPVAASGNGFASIAIGNAGERRPADAPQDLEARYWSEHVNNVLAKGVTKFTLDMNRAIYDSLRDSTRGVLDKRPNVVFSPLSIVGTLATILLGSAGVTFEQAARILGLESGVDISSHSEIVHLMLGNVFRSIGAKTNSLAPQIAMANGMFVQTGFPIRQEFKTISERAYSSEVVNLDFVKKPDESRNAVNDWVESRTRGKIARILEHPLDSDTKLIIVSALYFSGEWNQFFYPRSTMRKPFSVTPNESVMVDMMYNGGTFPYHEDKQLGLKMIALPYKGYNQDSTGRNGSTPRHGAAMYLVLPTAKDAEAVKRLEGRLNAETLEDLIGKMRNETCTLGVPRMKLSSSLNLVQALRSLGLTSLFDPRASNLGLVSAGRDATTIAEKSPIFNSRSGAGSGDGTNDDDDHRESSGPVGAQIPEKIPRESVRRRSADGSSAGPRRRARPIDQDFVRFIESRGIYPNYGLDALRNGPNLGNPGLFASDVLHKVEMEVTETGTVAAAATAATVQRGGDVKRFLANRPFLFFVRHEASRLVLFWGNVNEPTPHY